MFDDEFDPRTKKRTLKNLEPMSIDELQDYIVSLMEEITRTEGEIARKQAHAAAASSFFKPKS